MEFIIEVFPDILCKFTKKYDTLCHPGLMGISRIDFKDFLYINKKEFGYQIIILLIKLMNCQSDEDIQIFSEECHKKIFQLFDLEMFNDESFNYQNSLNEIINLISNQKVDEEDIIKKYENELKVKTNELKKCVIDIAEKEKEIKDLTKQIHEFQMQQEEFKILSDDEINCYEKHEKICESRRGKVYKAYKKSLFTLKIMKSNAKNIKFFLNEYEIIKKLNHPNILKTLGIHIKEKTKPPSIIFEYCENCLDTVIKGKKLSKVQIVFSIYQIVQGMKYIHSKNLIHLDLNPTNIFITDDGIIKIGDFEISQFNSPQDIMDSISEIEGSLFFMSPEFVNNKTFDEKADVYSFGVLIYYILNGCNMPNISLCDYVQGKKAEIPKSFTQFTQKLINSCWNIESKNRPSFEDINDQLAKNNYQLIDLSDSEVTEVMKLIKNYQKKYF